MSSLAIQTRKHSIIQSLFMNKIIQINKIPQKPGVYLFKNSNGKVIYVGKAKNLKKRVAYYYKPIKSTGDLAYDGKTENLVSEIADLKYFVTDNETEAILLEDQLIKKHKPKYNIQLKDSKRYAYLRLTKEKFPRLLVARDKKKSGTYFGPYASGQARFIAMKLAREVFKIRTCSKLPKKPCLRFHINLCDAPCAGNISEADYNKNISKAKKFLKGSAHELIKELTEEMKELTYKQEYEKARILRDQIFALESFSERQKVVLSKKYSEDVINYEIVENKVYFQVFNIKKGVILEKSEFIIEKTRSDLLLFEFIKSYYKTNKLPDEIIVPRKIFSQDELSYWLSLRQNEKAKFFVPKKGNKLKLLELVRQNIRASISEENPALIQLQEVLNLPAYPNVIECFDVSNLGKRINVGSMVYFKNGKADKNNYRKFHIRTIRGQDDYLSMAEIISRRYLRLMKENRQMPDLIIVDGGKGQVSAALKILNALELDIPVFGLAKRNEEIFLPNKKRPIVLKRGSEGLKMIQRIRDEAHRFAIKYQKELQREI